MKKTILLLALAVLVAGGVFAQKVGDTVKVGGKDYRLEEVRGDGRLVFQPVATLDGVWRQQGSGTNYALVTISGNTGVITHWPTGGSNKTQSAIEKGYIKIGETPYYRNLRKTGDLTWTGQVLQVTNNTSAPNVATGTSWTSITITLNANGQTFTDGATWTRQ